MTETQTILKPQDVRVGNWVQFDNEVIKVTDIFNGGINVCDDNYETYPIHYLQQLEPIPLTPEILEKAGFKKGYQKDWRRLNITPKGSNTKFCFVACIAEGIDNWVDYTVDDVFATRRRTNIKHLHQLQNLYFALTGEELEIEL
jgi:hypothetical protein